MKWLGAVFEPSLDLSSGTVLTTATELSGYLWGFVLVQGATTSWKATPHDLGFCQQTVTAGVSYKRPKNQAHTIASSVTTEPFGTDNPLVVPTTGIEYNDESWDLIYTAPTFPNGMTVLGEVDKMVPVSQQRISNISFTQSGVAITLRGTAGENVTFHYLVPGATKSRLAHCVIAAEGVGELTLSL